MESVTSSDVLHHHTGDPMLLNSMPLFPPCTPVDIKNKDSAVSSYQDCISQFTNKQNKYMNISHGLTIKENSLASVTYITYLGNHDIFMFVNELVS